MNHVNKKIVVTGMLQSYYYLIFLFNRVSLIPLHQAAA